MEISYQKILSIKCILADVKKSDLSGYLDVDPAILSRDIKSEKLKKIIDQYFDSIDPGINIAVEKMIEKRESILQEPIGTFYQKVDIMTERLEELKRQLMDKEKIIHLLEKNDKK